CTRWSRRTPITGHRRPRDQWPRRRRTSQKGCFMFGFKARDLPGRVATCGYILHTGLEKWKGDEARAKALHSMAANAFPVLKDIPPNQFLKLLAGTEIALGTALLAPVVPGAL